MRHINDPAQSDLFDFFEQILSSSKSPVDYDRLTHLAAFSISS